jgi:hypothetical protein
MGKYDKRKPNGIMTVPASALFNDDNPGGKKDNTETIYKIAKEFAKERGQDGRSVSDADFKKAIDLIQNKNKKFMTGR